MNNSDWFWAVVVFIFYRFEKWLSYYVIVFKQVLIWTYTCLQPEIALLVLFLSFPRTLPGFVKRFPVKIKKHTFFVGNFFETLCLRFRRLKQLSKQCKQFDQKMATHFFYKQLSCLGLSLRFEPKTKHLTSNFPAPNHKI